MGFLDRNSHPGTRNQAPTPEEWAEYEARKAQVKAESLALKRAQYPDSQALWIAQGPVPEPRVYHYHGPRYRPED